MRQAQARHGSRAGRIRCTGTLGGFHRSIVSSVMAAATHLDLSATQAALRAVAGVLDDHRPALDRLDLGEGWADGDEPTESTAPSRPGSGPTCPRP